MGIFDSLQSMLGGGAATPATAGSGAGAGGLGGLAGGLGDLLSSGAMGGIASTILGNKKGGVSWLKAALVAGAGSMLWKRLTQQMAEQAPASSPYSRPAAATEAPADLQAQRLVRAIVFASKADGHIDNQEKAAINQQIRKMNLGRAGEDFVNEAMNEPLDPRLIADGVTNPEEALQLYAISSAVIDPDQFMEKNYLDALSQELKIPPNIKTQIDSQIHQAPPCPTAGR